MATLDRVTSQYTSKTWSGASTTTALTGTAAGNTLAGKCIFAAADQPLSTVADSEGADPTFSGHEFANADHFVGVAHKVEIANSGSNDHTWTWTPTDTVSMYSASVSMGEYDGQGTTIIADTQGALTEEVTAQRSQSDSDEITPGDSAALVICAGRCSAGGLVNDADWTSEILGTRDVHAEVTQPSATAITYNLAHTLSPNTAIFIVEAFHEDGGGGGGGRIMSSLAGAGGLAGIGGIAGQGGGLAA